jgi:hypothetical protein
MSVMRKARVVFGALATLLGAGPLRAQIGLTETRGMHELALAGLSYGAASPRDTAVTSLGGNGWLNVAPALLQAGPLQVSVVLGSEFGYRRLSRAMPNSGASSRFVWRYLYGGGAGWSVAARRLDVAAHLYRIAGRDDFVSGSVGALEQWTLRLSARRGRMVARLGVPVASPAGPYTRLTEATVWRGNLGVRLQRFRGTLEPGTVTTITAMLGVVQ